MPAVKGLAELGTLVAAAHGWPEAKRFKTYHPTEDDKAILANCATETLQDFPDLAGACSVMSAAFATNLKRSMAAPIHVVAGSLYADGEHVFGGSADPDFSATFSHSATDWDGHVWIMIGPYVADISLFRTAYANSAPPALARLVWATFGPNLGMYFDAWRETRKLGLRYEPRYVLPASQVDGLTAGAETLINAHRMPE